MNCFSYEPPWYLRNGLGQTIAITYWYGQSWNLWKEQVRWLKGYPEIRWQETIFSGAEGVPLWGKWACPAKARGTIIINYGLNGDTEKAWYAYLTAYKAYHQGWAVLVYDWRGHGKSAELSPVPPCDGWREGADQVQLAEQLVALGCPSNVVLVGFSMGGQLVLWGLAQQSPLIKAGAVLSPNLESNRSLTHLLSYPMGRLIEQRLAKDLMAQAQRQQQSFPEKISSEVVGQIDSIASFDREIVIDYYGFSSVSDYYQKTSSLYLLDQINQPYLVVYAQDDPLFDPSLIPEIKEKVERNDGGTLLLSKHGGHISHIAKPNPAEDQFWGINRLLAFVSQFE